MIFSKDLRNTPPLFESFEKSQSTQDISVQSSRACLGELYVCS